MSIFLQAIVTDRNSLGVRTGALKDCSE